jgi:hypothetical protein
VGDFAHAGKHSPSASAHGPFELVFKGGFALKAYTISGVIAEAASQHNYGRVLERVEQGGETVMTGEYLLRQIRRM